MTTKLQQIHLKGLPLSQGIAIGPLHFVDIPEELIPEYVLAYNEIELEIARFKAAVGKGLYEIQCLLDKLWAEHNTEGAAILDTHLHIMQDPLMLNQVECEIRETNKNAEYAFHAVFKRYQAKFSTIKDSLFLDRLKDIRNVSRRILGHLRKDASTHFQVIPPQAIIFMRELSPTDVVEAYALSVAAFVTQGGGAASHAAIVSKAKGIPLISNVDFNQLDFPLEGIAIVDGATGDVFINPNGDIVEEYAFRRDHAREAFKKLLTHSSLKTETYDGHSVRLSANISVFDELEQLHAHRGDGVGLFRSEYIFLSDEEFPDEEKQFQTYRQMIEGMKGLPIVIRVFDLGGDKCLVGQKGPYENNPFLGCRAIRFLLRERHLFKVQLKAILRASVYGDVSVMFPMVSGLKELQEAKELLRDVQLELQLDSGMHFRPLRVGCMIEVPSAAMIADLLAQECDFLSIGTNDLVQYSLALDRDNHSFSELYTPTHPGVLRLIKHVVSAASIRGIPVTVCGEAAADPCLTALLLGLGIHELSVSPCHIPKIREAIRNCSIVDAVQFAERVLAGT